MILEEVKDAMKKKRKIYEKTAGIFIECLNSDILMKKCLWINNINKQKYIIIFMNNHFYLPHGLFFL